MALLAAGSRNSRKRSKLLWQANPGPVLPAGSRCLLSALWLSAACPCFIQTGPCSAEPSLWLLSPRLACVGVLEPTALTAASCEWVTIGTYHHSAVLLSVNPWLWYHALSWTHSWSAVGVVPSPGFGTNLTSAENTAVFSLHARTPQASSQW